MTRETADEPRPNAGQWQTVPREPTEAMIKAAREYGRYGRPSPTGYFRAMLAAASPSAEAAQPAPAQVGTEPTGVVDPMREKVARIVEAAIERHNPGNSLRHTLDDADAILAAITGAGG